MLKRKQQPNKKELKEMSERRAKAQDFINDFQALTTRYGLTFQPGLSQDVKHGVVTALKATMQVVEYEADPEAQVKPWSECARENLEQRAKCKHRLNKFNTECKICGLPTKYWGIDNIGVSEEYRAEQEKKIEQWATEEAEEAKKATKNQDK